MYIEYAGNEGKNIKWCFFDVRLLIPPAGYVNFNFKKLIKYISVSVKTTDFAVCEEGKIVLFIVRFDWRKCP